MKRVEAKKYNVIYADPPWQYGDNTGRGFKHGAKEKYDIMSNDDIYSMPIEQMTQKDCVCFLWVTVPLLPEGMNTLKSWGFEYKTTIVWRKIMSLGMGWWFRGQVEFLIMGVKGKVKAFRQQRANFYESEYFDVDESVQTKAGKHSQKPHVFREIINKAVSVSFENPVKLELFARSRSGLFPNDEYEGWDVYGNEVNGSIELPEVA